MFGIRPYHQRLVGDGGAQSNYLGSLFTLVGPTDLTLFSSPIDGHLLVLKRRVTQDRVNIFWA